jgi:hypothetical protein
MPTAVLPKFATRVLAVACLAAASVTATVSPADAASKPAYVGIWGIDAKSCKASETDLVISTSSWGEVDSECSIRAVRGGNGTWTLSLFKCKGDGVKPTATVTIKIAANRATTHYFGSTFSNTFVRCH